MAGSFLFDAKFGNPATASHPILAILSKQFSQEPGGLKIGFCVVLRYRKEV